MPVTSHTLVLTPQSDGSQTGPLRMYDQNSLEYMATLVFAPGVTQGEIDAQVDRCIAAMDEQLAQDEFERLVVAPYGT